jgi:ABC-type thiamine transport system substrate-binding protein
MRKTASPPPCRGTLPWQRSQAALADTPTLTVYTYDSFTVGLGPRPRDQGRVRGRVRLRMLEFVGAGDGAALLARLQLEGTRTGPMSCWGWIPT